MSTVQPLEPGSRHDLRVGISPDAPDEDSGGGRADAFWCRSCVKFLTWCAKTSASSQSGFERQVWKRHTLSPPRRELLHGPQVVRVAPFLRAGIRLPAEFGTAESRRSPLAETGRRRSPVSSRGSYAPSLWPGNTSVSDLCQTGESPPVSTLKPYSKTRLPPKVAPTATRRAMITDSTMIPTGVTAWV